MSRRIREDLEGVVYAPDGAMLKAGDEEPKGVTLGDHLFAEGAQGGPEKPAGNASLEAWQDYAKTKGATEEDVEGQTRDDLKATYSD